MIADAVVLAVTALAVLVEPSAYLALAFCAWVCWFAAAAPARSTKVSEYCVDQAGARPR